jgi:hypothetical protein
MKVELRIAGSKVGSVQNHVFKPRKSIKVSLLPLPEWLKDPTCHICNQRAKFLLPELNPICQKCVEGMIVGMNKKEVSTDTGIPLTKEVIAHSRFEWSTDGERWYSLWGKGIKPDNFDVFLRDLRKSLLEGSPLFIEAEYDKETKEMRILC